MEVKIITKILKANDEVAAELRREFDGKKIFCINLMSSPGSGKTTLLEKTIEGMKEKTKIGVIEGDITTSIDAERLQKTGAEVVEINTKPFGGDCHLEAGWIRESFHQMEAKGLDLLIIENIGNLVCPAEFDTGAHKNIVMLSVAEGEDKPLKYPLMFHKSDLLIISKSDLIEIQEFDIGKLLDNVKKVNPDIDVIIVSARKNTGIEEWIGWLNKNISIKK
ncbi:hydrogenase nickel incorporation protein HypB [Elusimicrobiota bacterium]